MKALFLLQILFIAVLPAQTIIERFPPPEGFKRLTLADTTFGAWLRQRPLLPPGSPLCDFNNRIRKPAEDSTLAAIVDMDIRGRRLEQCMDILMRLYSQWLVENNKTEQLRWPMPGGVFLSWSDWRQGRRPVFKRDHYELSETGPAPDNDDLDAYLNTLYALSGTQTFYFAYRPVDRQNVRPGDFIVKKSTRHGHTVLIMDVVVNKAGTRRVMVAQGDTPAVPLHVLRGANGSVWFPVDERPRPALPIRKKMYWSGLRRFSRPGR